MSTSRPAFNSYYEEDTKSMGYHEDLANGWGLRINDMPEIVSAAARGDNKYVKGFCKYHKARGTLGCINAVDTMYNRTALFWAATNNHVAVVQTLLEFGANPNTEDFVTRSAPLNTAAEHGHLGVVEALVSDKNTNVNHLRSINKKDTYQERMIESVFVSMIKSQGVPKEAGISPLWIAAYYGHESVVRRLLACEGIDVEAKLLKGQTARDIALSRGHSKIASMIEAAEKDARWKRSDEYKEQQRKAQEEKERVEAEELLRRSEAYLNSTRIFLADFQKQNSGALSCFHRPSAQSQQLITDIKRLMDDNSDANTKADSVRARLLTYHADRKWKVDRKKPSRTIDLLQRSQLWSEVSDMAIRPKF